MIVAYLVVIVAMFVVINFAVDLLYTLLDPRVRLSEREAWSMSLFPSTAAAPGETRFSVAWSEFAQSRTAVAALGVAVVLIALAVLAPWVAPQNPYDSASSR